MSDQSADLVAAAQLSTTDALQLLRHGVIEPEGLLAEASNTTLRAFIAWDGRRARCVYKPVRGERPLWDFPDGTLAGREISAYLLSAATGWDIVPPTVLRDGPAGTGICQLWIDGDRTDELVGFVPADDIAADWCPIAAAQGPQGERFVLAHAPDERLARMAVFDAVINNADRKGAHVLCGTDGRVFGVDHGVSFHVEEKLRTVLWGWAGHQLPDDTLGTLRALRAELDGALGEQLDEHLTQREIRATVARTERLLETGRYPMPGEDWPALPWPPI